MNHKAGSQLQEKWRTGKGTFSLLHFISDVFRPLVPVFIGAGIIRFVILAILMLDTLGYTDIADLDSPVYKLFNSIASLPLYLLPVLIGVSTAHRLKSNLYVAGVVGGLMLYPEMTALLNGEKQASVLGVDLFALPAFYSAAIWVILAVSAAAYAERELRRVMPRDQEGIASAVLTLLVLIPAVVLVLGPLGIFLNDHIGDAIASLMGNAPVLNLLLLGLVYSLLVMTGLQFVLIPLILNELATNGSTMLLPAAAAAMMGHAGAALAVALREQRPDSRRLAFWAAGAALLGTPEPAMYAVNMKRRAAFGSALLGGAAGGLYIGLFSVKAVAFGGGLSLLEFPLLLDEGTPSLLQGMTAIILAYVFAAALTYWLLGRKGSRGAVEGERSS